MLGSVFKEVKGIFGRGYLLAGLLPASLLLLGYYWFSLRSDGFKKLIESWLEAKERTGATLLTMTEILVAGFVFYAIRIPVMSFCQEMPGVILRPLREALIHHQAGILRKLESKRELSLWRVTVARWYETGFDQPAYLPKDVFPIRPKECVEASKKARKRIDKLVAKNAKTTGWRDCENILDSLSSLYACLTGSGSTNKLLLDEVQIWRALVLATPKAGEIMNDLDVYVRRQHVPVFTKLQAFPQPSGLRPTAVGNEVAALDDYSEKRYGMDASSMWARVREVVPKFARDEVTTAELNLETVLNLCLATVILFVAEVATILARISESSGSSGLGLDRWPWLFGACTAVLAVLMYRAAVYTARTFRQRVVSLLDLHSLSLLVALGFRPKTVGEKHELYRALRRLFVQAIPLDAGISLVASTGKKEEASGKGDEET